MIRLLLFKSSIIIIGVILLPIIALSQKRDNPLEPAPRPLLSEVGLFAGFGANIQSGNFYSSCDCPEFSDGKLFGFTLGALYDKEIVENLFAGAALMYDNRSVTASYKVHEMDTVKTTDGRIVDSLPLWFRNVGKAELSYLSLMPYLRWEPAKIIFIRLGVSASFLVSSGFKHTKELLQQSATLNTGEVVSVNYDDGSTVKEIKQTKPFATNSFQLSLEPALGFNFQLSKRYFLSPLFQYSLPFLNTSDKGNFKVSAWRIFLELRYQFEPKGNN